MASTRKTNQVSHLGRDIDPSYRTNLIIMILTPLSAVVVFVLALVSNMPPMQAASAAFFTTGMTFGSWAFAREIDPDHDWSAFVGVAFAWVAAYLYRAPVLGMFSLGMMLYALRMTNRVIGFAPTIADSALILLAIIITAFLDNWVVAWIGIAAFLLDGLLVNPVRRHLAFAAVGAVITLLRLVILDFPATGSLTGLNVIAVIVVSIAFFLTIAATRKVKSQTDMNNQALDVRRIRAAMILTLAAAFVSALWNGDAGINWMLPLWCAMLGVAVYRLPVTIYEWRTYQQQKAKSA
jgi:hypothetical protein